MDPSQRRYSRAEIGRVQRVSEMAGEGMTLAGIRRILVLEAEVAGLRQELERERNGRATPSHRR
jgi:MerR family transcriptional regulator/heat shock protein HspR